MILGKPTQNPHKIQGKFHGGTLTQRLLFSPGCEEAQMEAEFRSSRLWQKLEAICDTLHELIEENNDAEDDEQE